MNLRKKVIFSETITRTAQSVEEFLRLLQVEENLLERRKNGAHAEPGDDRKNQTPGQFFASDGNYCINLKNGSNETAARPLFIIDCDVAAGYADGQELGTASEVDFLEPCKL